MGAHLNVKINCADFDDKAFVVDMLAKASDLEAKTRLKETDILNIVNGKIG